LKDNMIVRSCPGIVKWWNDRQVLSRDCWRIIWSLGLVSGLLNDNMIVRSFSGIVKG